MGEGILVGVISLLTWGEGVKVGVGFEYGVSLIKLSITPEGCRQGQALLIGETALKKTKINKIKRNSGFFIAITSTSEEVDFATFM